MAYFIQLAFAGIALGCIYALIGLGFSIIFKASGVINFAQGEMLMVGAYIISSGVFVWHINFFLALILGIILTVIIGLLFERFVLWRMVGRPVFSILMITIGLDILLRTAVTVGWGSNPVPPGTPFGNDSGVNISDIISAIFSGAKNLWTLIARALLSGINIGGVHFGANDLWTIVVTILLCVLLYFFFQSTKYGLAMRATAIDQEAALAMGINIRTVNMLAWGISAAIATIGGVFLAAKSVAVDPTLGGVALLAFPAIILGGVDSISGAVIGGIIIGLTEVLTAGYESQFVSIIGAGFHEIAPYLIMLLVLFIRPYGLFGTRKVERV